jgi:putative cell wall-binding protein
MNSSKNSKNNYYKSNDDIKTDVDTLKKSQSIVLNEVKTRYLLLKEETDSIKSEVTELKTQMSEMKLQLTELTLLLKNVSSQLNEQSIYGK